jgi:hypothetical protein
MALSHSCRRTSRRVPDLTSWRNAGTENSNSDLHVSTYYVAPRRQRLAPVCSSTPTDCR